jgi:acetylornithine deacetylase/succinyl-diaminopimelate desuccinylase-like protein
VTEKALLSEVRAAVDRDRLVRTAIELVAIPSPTGQEEAAADYLCEVFEDLGVAVTKQEIEPGRANAVARLEGVGDGPTLMLNGHLDTSYSGDEPWLEGPGFKPDPIVRDDTILGLGIMNMKGSVACYVEAVRALRDAGVTLTGDLVVAAVAGEIEKAEWGDEFRGAFYRGYGVGTRHLVAQGVLADACILGEPTEEKVVLGHYGTLWARVSTSGPFFHTAFSAGRLAENSIVRMQEVLADIRSWIPTWEERTTYQGLRGVANIGALRGGFPWRASRTPHRTDLFLDLRVPPTMDLAEAEQAVGDLVDRLRARYPDYGISSEIYVAVPGAEIDPDHPVVAALETAHHDVFGRAPERSYVRWGSDASTLSRHGVASVNYGPISPALPGPEGESVPIPSLVRLAAAYALTAVHYCGVKS